MFGSLFTSNSKIIPQSVNQLSNFFVKAGCPVGNTLTLMRKVSGSSPTMLIEEFNFDN